MNNKDHQTIHSTKHEPSPHAKADGHEVGEHGGDKVIERYPITTTDFGRVETPFIIGIWILFASIAKIGELHHTQIASTMVLLCSKIASILSSSGFMNQMRITIYLHNCLMT